MKESELPKGRDEASARRVPPHDEHQGNDEPAPEDPAGYQNTRPADPATTEFWRFLQQVMEYAVDATECYPLFWGPARVGEIDEQTFLTRLYVCRDDGRYEQRLVHAMLSTLHLLAVSSPRGSGKTSALYYARHMIENDPRNRNTSVVLIDFRRLYDRERLHYLNPTEAEARFRKLLESEVRSRFFDGVDATRSYVAWALAGQPDESDPFEPTLTSDLIDVASVVQAEAHAEHPQRESRYHKLKNWFTAENDRYVSILREVQPLLRVAHVVMAARKLLSLEKVVLIYDNVDKIPPEHQRSFLEVADNSQVAMGAIASTCVAIRTETLPGQWIPIENRGGSLVDLLLPNAREYPAILLPQPQVTHTNAVLDRRHVFAHALCEKLFPDWNIRRTLAVVHNRVIHEFADSAIHRMTNESMRAVISIYIGFSQYLEVLCRARRIDPAQLLSTQKREGHAHTLFYLWLGVFGQRFGIYLYDVIKLDPQDEDRPFHDVASEHYFVLTALANLTRDGERRLTEPPFPEFAQLVTRMGMLGFTFEQVVDAVAVMCTRRNEDTRTVEFYDTEPHIEELTPTSTNRIRLTLLGDVLISRLLSKVGYVWRSAHQQEGDKVADPEDEYLNLTVPGRIAIIIRYLRHLARVHLKLLARLRSDWEPRFGDDWLISLRQMFGIDRKLQLELILLDAAKFYDHHFAALGLDNQFNVLGRVYAELLGRVERGQPHEEQLAAEFGKVELTIDEVIGRETGERRDCRGD